MYRLQHCLNVSPSSEAADRRITSVAQDIIFSASNGKIRKQKHFSLPLTVQHLTRSEQLVSILNRFGHGYSSSRILEVLATMAERTFQHVDDSGAFLPSNINLQRRQCSAGTTMISGKTLHQALEQLTALLV